MGDRAESGRGTHAAPAWWRRLTWAEWGLELRPARSADAVLVAGAITDEIARSVGAGTADRMQRATVEWTSSADEVARRGDVYRYVVIRDGRFAGTIETSRDAVRGHVGYWLRRAERGRGTATRAVRLVLPIAFEGIGLPAVDFTSDAANSASIAVMKRVGASLVARYAAPATAEWETEVRYRLRCRAYRPAPDGPARLADLVTSVR